ncbi:hypothetical protein [Microbacterium schleiferi]|uniref:Uncharacterized protein n=1 Tax=Microbacterium schleiferi TaxID=69362 RepID=A0ABU7V7K6_9MICO
MAKWYTVTNTETPDDDENDARDRLLAAWPGAPLENIEMLSMLLTTAKGDVIAYAPEPADDEDIENDPLDRYVLAQLKQARNIWNDGSVDSEGQIGDGGFTFTPRPLDRTIRGVIRHRSGKPRVL